MNVRALMALALAGVLWPAAVLAAGCYSGSQGYGAFPLVATADGHIATLIPIGNKVRLMLIDTGGATSELSAEVANDLDLTPKSLPGGIQVDVAGRSAADYVVVPKFKFGGAVFSDVHFVVFSPSDKEDESGVDGMLAPDILGEFDVDLDFGHNEMHIFDKNHCPGKIPFWSPTYASAPFDTDSSRHVIVSMTLDGKPVHVTFDTGAPRSVMSMDVANRLFGLSPGVKGVEPEGSLNKDDPSQTMFRHRFVSLAVDGLEVKNPMISLMPDNLAKATNGDAHLPDVILGLKNLAALHLFIAYQEKEIYLTSAGAEYPGAEAARQWYAIAMAKARAEHTNVIAIPLTDHAPAEAPPLRPPFPDGLTAPVAVGPHDCAYSFGYPAAAYVTGAEGTTDLSFVVAADGSIRSVDIVRSSGNAALDHASVDCVLPWKFQPATLNGSPVEVVQTTSRVWKLP